MEYRFSGIRIKKEKEQWPKKFKNHQAWNATSLIKKIRQKRPSDRPMYGIEDFARGGGGEGKGARTKCLSPALPQCLLEAIHFITDSQYQEKRRSQRMSLRERVNLNLS